MEEVEKVKCSSQLPFSLSFGDGLGITSTIAKMVTAAEQEGPQGSRVSELSSGGQKKGSVHLALLLWLCMRNKFEHSTTVQPSLLLSSPHDDNSRWSSSERERRHAGGC